MTEQGQIWKKRFYLLLFGTIVIRLIIMGIPEVTPQDAYYWQYSRHLDWGYFDHPGMTAYTIRLFCTIFGDNLYGIRFTALFYSIGFMILIYLFGKRLYSRKVGFWAAFTMALTPLGIVGGLFVTPDPALIFFWMASVYFFHRAWKDEVMWNYLLAGGFAGLAMLSKYTAVFLFAGFFIVLLTSKRKHLLTPWPWIGLVLSVLFFLPQVYWNYQNEWASFAFQSTRRADQVRRLRLDYFFGYIGSQLMVVTPLVYVGMLFSLFVNLKKRIYERDDRFFLMAFSLPMLLFFTFVGLFYWVKVNWLAPAYLTGIILFLGMESKSKRFFKVAMWIVGILGGILYLQLSFSPIPASGEMMTVAGWEMLRDEVLETMEKMPEPKTTFVFGWEYKVPSVLSFYLPGQPETFGNDVLGQPLLQYQYWFEEEALLGRDAVFVVDKRQKFVPPGTTKRQWWDMDIPTRRQTVIDYLEKHFESVVWNGDFLPEFRGKTITRFSIYRCHGYTGTEISR